jgi:hypothetical protein
MKQERLLRRDLARTENLSRERIARMTGGKDSATFTDDKGRVFWKDSQRPVMVYDKEEGGEAHQLTVNDKADTGVVTERDVFTAANKMRSELDGNVASMVIIDGKQTSWRSLSEQQKGAYMESVTETMRQQIPQNADQSSVPAWAR